MYLSTGAVLLCHSCSLFVPFSSLDCFWVFWLSFFFSVGFLAVTPGIVFQLLLRITICIFSLLLSHCSLPWNTVTLYVPCSCYNLAFVHPVIFYFYPWYKPQCTYFFNQFLKEIWKYCHLYLPVIMLFIHFIESDFHVGLLPS